MLIKLNQDQFNYLNSHLSEDQRMSWLVKPVGQSIVIEVDEDRADQIRDWAGEELQRKGFDLNYRLTPEGKLLYELIDLFYTN